MGERERERKARRAREAKEAGEAQPNPEIARRGKKLKEDLDVLLDEIDEVLEENAEDFVRAYVQRGGQ